MPANAGGGVAGRLPQERAMPKPFTEAVLSVCVLAPLIASENRRRVAIRP